MTNQLAGIAIVQFETKAKAQYGALVSLMYEEATENGGNHHVVLGTVILNAPFTVSLEYGETPVDGSVSNQYT